MAWFHACCRRTAVLALEAPHAPSVAAGASTPNQEVKASGRRFN